MTSLELLGQLFRHMEWADAGVWRAILATPATATDTDIRDRLRHLHGTQRAFLCTWVGRPVDYDEAKGMDLPALARWTRDGHVETGKYLASLREEDLDRPHVVPWSARVSKALGREAGVTALRDTLLQAAAHSHYHRGQVNTRLRQLGGTPARVDFIGWIWMGTPEPEWPAE